MVPTGYYMHNPPWVTELLLARAILMAPSLLRHLSSTVPKLIITLLYNDVQKNAHLICEKLRKELMCRKDIPMCTNAKCSSGQMAIYAL